MKFTSHNNTLELDLIDWFKDLIAVYTNDISGESQYIVFKFKGDVWALS